MVTALELHYWGGPVRLTWTEYRDIPQPVLDAYDVVADAARTVKERRGQRNPRAPGSGKGRGV